MLNVSLFENILWSTKAKLEERVRAVGVVEVILILLVLVGLVLIFKDQLVTMANSIFTNINSQVDDVPIS